MTNIDDMIKAYVKIEEEDEVLDLIIPAAEKYVEAAVGDRVEDPRWNLFLCGVAQHMYDNRNLYAPDSQSMAQKLDQVFCSIVQQLQIEKMIREEEANETT